MAVFRIEKTRDYTVMSNHHLRDKTLSLKAKGLLSLSLIHILAGISSDSAGGIFAERNIAVRTGLQLSLIHI